YQKEGQENDKQLYVSKCEDITFRHIRILDGQTTDHKRGMVGLQSVRNVDITYCTLDIPAGISSDPEKGSCNLSFGNGWHDVSTTHCEIINESGLKTGGAIGYNDIYASGSENALFENNVVRYNVKDEVIAIFSHSRQGSDYFGRDSHIRNIMIRHNEFYGPKSDNWKRDLDFSVGYEDSLEVDNVVYEENYFETDAVWAFMSFSKTATNCAARGNVIHVNQTSSQTSMSVFTTTGAFPAVIEDNVIEISSENENTPSCIVHGRLQFRNNQVTTNGSMQYLFTGGAVSEQNQITVNGSVTKAVSYQGGDMTDTSITITGKAGSMYESYKMEMSKDIIWKDNEIKLPNADSTGALMTFNGMKMNGHHFIMEGNHIETPSVTKNALIIYDALQDDNPKEQTIILKDNEFGAYNSKGNTVQIYRSGNVFQLADKSTIMDYEVVFDTEGKAKVESQSVIGGEKVSKPEEPEVRGFEFEGWYKDNTFKNLWDFENDVINDHTILYAKFQKIALKEFSLSHKEIAGNAGEQIQLSASFVPEETLETELSYTSENSKVADVDENGLVRLVGEGKTILTIVSREQPQLKIEIPVIVKQPEQPTEEESATKEPTTEETTTEKPTEKPTEEEPTTKEPTTEATTTEKPTEKPTEEEPATKEPTTEERKADMKIMPEVGTLLTDDRTNAVYRVTVSDVENATAAYVRPVNKNAVKVTIAKKVTLNGITYKVTSIDANAFRGCKKLRNISIGSEITEIGNAAFYKCTSLTKITIPAKVSKIGKKTFYGCKKLKTITIKTKKLSDKKVGSKAFKGISSKAVVKVPKSRLKNYRKLLRKKGIGARVKVR
ncbi:MAG: leucine-rich repeat protein, partial [Clostridiales bacterium]|nr:leucine-rich repeat protein [Clostridiales bacterium]